MSRLPAMTHGQSRRLLGFVGVFATLVVASPVARSQSQFGTIKGRLVWGGRALPVPRILIAKGDPAVKDCATCADSEIPDESLVLDPKTKGVANAFAYVVDPKRSNPDLERKLIEARPFLTMDQKGCRYVPHALALHKDQALVFRSRDAIAHNNRFKPKNSEL